MASARIVIHPLGVEDGEALSEKWRVKVDEHSRGVRKEILCDDLLPGRFPVPHVPVVRARHRAQPAEHEADKGKKEGKREVRPNDSLVPVLEEGRPLEGGVRRLFTAIGRRNPLSFIRKPVPDIEDGRTWEDGCPLPHGSQR